MYKLSTTLISITMLLTSTLAPAWEPNVNDALELAVAQAIIKAKQRDPAMGQWFDSAYAYAVFPRVGKGGIVIGGAHGKGLVIRGNSTVGETSLSQITIGFQLGGQVYAQYIMFKDHTAFDHYTRGNFEMGAQASAVAITYGASADAAYDDGVAVFTMADGGLMFEASVGGQKFKFKAR